MELQINGTPSGTLRNILITQPTAKQRRRNLRRDIERVILRRGMLSDYLRHRSTPGALRSYAKKIAIAEVSRMRRAGEVR